MSDVPLLQSRAVTHEEIEASEWQARVDLAAFYRLAALYGWDDLLATHISARVPGADHQFLINPYGLRFSEITASSLVKIDLDGNKVAPSEYGINYAGFVIHSAIHAAREDAHWIVHFHTDDGVAVSSQKDGLLPLNQRSLGVLPRLTYHDYEGIALRLDERERLVTDLGPTSSLMLLRNHGTLALGPTAGAAWLGIYQLERACTAQIRALSAGRDGVLIAPEAAQREVAGLHSGDPARRAAHADLVWKALLRQVQKEAPDHDI